MIPCFDNSYDNCDFGDSDDSDDSNNSDDSDDFYDIQYTIIIWTFMTESSISWKVCILMCVFESVNEQIHGFLPKSEKVPCFQLASDRVAL